jgi:hypothetical protein
MKLFLLLLALIATADAQEAKAFLELSSDRWQVDNFLIDSQGFAVHNNSQVFRFRWKLPTPARIEPQSSPFESKFTVLGLGRTPRLTKRLQVSWPGTKATASFYLGNQGLEFDLNLSRLSDLPDCLFESLDANLELTSNGALLLLGKAFLAPPATRVGLSEKPANQEPFHFDIQSSRLVSLAKVRTVAIPSDQPLVIDPVVSYASFFGPTPSSILAVKDLPNSITVVAGVGQTFEFPNALWIHGNGLPTTLSPFESSGCFLTRFDTSSGMLLGSTWISGFYCASAFIDEMGRLTAVGTSKPGQFQPSGNAEMTFPSFRLGTDPDWVLLRLAPGANVVEYSTYLEIPQNEKVVLLAPPPNATSSKATFVVFTRRTDWNQLPFLNNTTPFGVPYGQPADYGALIYEYDLSLRRVSRRIGYRDSQMHFFSGAHLNSNGQVVLFGPSKVTPSVNSVAPLLAFQSGQPEMPGTFLIGFELNSPRITFASYFGGLKAFSRVDSVFEAPDGALLLAGSGQQGSIPGQEAAESGFSSPLAEQVFLATVRPGVLNPIRTAFAPWNANRSSPFVQHSSGEICWISLNISPTSRVRQISCSNRDASAIVLREDFVTWKAEDSFLIGVASNSGLWLYAAQSGLGEPYPFSEDLLQKAFIQSATPSSTTNIILYKLNLSSPPPKYLGPLPMVLSSVQYPYTSSIMIPGENLLDPMRLEFGGKSFPLATRFSTQAFVDVDASTGLPPGEYSATLRSGTRSSESFPVRVNRLRPTLNPVLPRNLPVTSVATTVKIQAPVYPETQVFLRGERLLDVVYTPPPSTNPFSETTLAVTLPSGSLINPGPAEFVIHTPGPGGGISRQTVIVGPTQPEAAPRPYPSDYMLVDEARRKAFNIVRRSDLSRWELDRLSLPDLTIEQSIQFPATRAGEFILSSEVSSDGAYLYLLFSTGRFIRLLSSDLASSISIDSLIPPVSEATGQIVAKPLIDDPESFVVSNPLGELVVYTGLVPRTFDSSFFPRKRAPRLIPILASRDFVYAIEPSYGSCLLRFRVDALGLFPPDFFCNMAKDWGSHPEMLRFPGRFVLAHKTQAVSIRPFADPSQILANESIDLKRRWVYRNTFQGFNRGARFSVRIEVEDLDTGLAIGHFPREGPFDGGNGSIFLDDLLISREGNLFTSGSAFFYRNWQKDFEYYPLQP